MKQITTAAIKQMKQNGEPVTMVTAYDYAMDGCGRYAFYELSGKRGGRHVQRCPFFEGNRLRGSEA